MVIKTLADLNVKDKLILLRIDINSEIINGRVQNNPRFLAHSETINLLLKRNAKVVILAHQGNPGEKDFTSLEQHSKILNKYVKIKYVSDIIGKKAISEIQKLKSGEAILLENVRKLKDEFTPSKNNLFVKTLSKNADYYVNDAFSVMHRNQTSIVSFPSVLKSAVGPNVEDELKNLDKLRSKMKDSVFILGGRKIKDISLLLDKNKVLSTGTLSLLALKIKGHNLGKEEKILEKELKNNEIKNNIDHIYTPIDVAILKNGKRKEIWVYELPVNAEILDIGKETVKAYVNEIKKAKAVFFKGVSGKIEDKNFQYGTKEILKAIAKSKAFSIVAGGSSASSIDKFKISKKDISYISLSGGALVHYLAGKKLPGLEALKTNR